jgi:hypothetical protein
MTDTFSDKFTRSDGDIGSNYTVPCGGVVISDEAVIPIDTGAIVSGFSPLLPGVTAQKSQVLYTADTMDLADYVVRGTWAHDGQTATALDPANITTPNSFTILARMSKDPLLVDLRSDEDPHCYDQGYGARVTCPLDGSAPTLKLVKYMPDRRLPNMDRPASTEVDGMVVLTSVVLDNDDLNVDPAWDDTNYAQGDLLPYKGFWQDMRLRIRRADTEVILEVYLNDRNLNQPKLTWTDRRDPLWGEVGVPGFEFISGTVTPQPAGVSPFDLQGLSLMRCGLFSVATVNDPSQPQIVAPGSQWTYGRIVDRVIELVEKNGDAKYNATVAGRMKLQTYLRFVMEAEASIIRTEGYWQWLKREQRLYLINGQDEYEMPENIGELLLVRPGNWNKRPLQELTEDIFFNRTQGATQSGGQPYMFIRRGPGPNNRMRLRFFPVPLLVAMQTVNTEDPYLVIEYYARQLFPTEPDNQLPFVPQEDADVLVYTAAALALTLDTDDSNSQRMAQMAGIKMRELRRKNNRNLTNRQLMRSAADVWKDYQQVPLTRAASLGSLLYL